MHEHICSVSEISYNLSACFVLYYKKIADSVFYDIGI